MKLFCSLPNTSLDWVHHDTQTSTTHSFLIEEWVRFQALGGGELGGVDYVDTVVGEKYPVIIFQASNKMQQGDTTCVKKQTLSKPLAFRLWLGVSCCRFVGGRGAEA